MKLIVLLSHQADLQTIPSLLPRLDGCLLVADINETLLHVIRAVSNGYCCFSRQLIKPLFAAPPSSLMQTIAQAYPSLSASEQKVLHKLVLGWPNQQIAAELGFSHQTVRNYVKSIYAKVGVHRRAALVAKFVNVSEQD